MDDDMFERMRDLTPDQTPEEWAVRAAGVLMVISSHPGIVARNPERFEQFFRDLVAKMPAILMVKATLAVLDSKKIMDEFTNAEIPDYPPDNL